MTKKSIITVGLQSPLKSDLKVSLASDSSLFDYDIILFNPSFEDFYSSSDNTYGGQVCFYADKVGYLFKQIEHWQKEIRQALMDGKTVFVLLNDFYEVFVETKKTHTGTGKNRQETVHVDPVNNYIFVPFDISCRKAKGNIMRLAEESNIISSFWADLNNECEYRVVLECEVTQPLLYTKTGKNVVSALIKLKDSPGNLCLLPYIDFDRDDFTYHNEDEGRPYWNEKSIKVSEDLISAIIEIDTSLKDNKSAQPKWLNENNAYFFSVERAIKQKIEDNKSTLELLKAENTKLLADLEKETALKGLLYEQGRSLEFAVMLGLVALGFETESYRDQTSEFDVIFKAKEGRFLGEVEGKDNKAVNIDKFRQLSENLLEDLDRDGVDESAKGVLFGNAYRLSSPESRDEFFTDKCLTSAEKRKYALIRTPDLFYVAKYLSENDDDAFAEQCRRAIFDSAGIVEFPEKPEQEMKK